MAGLRAQARHPLTVPNLPHNPLPRRRPGAVRYPDVVSAGLLVHSCPVPRLGLNRMGNDPDVHQDYGRRAAHRIDFLRGQQGDARPVGDVVVRFIPPFAQSRTDVNWFYSNGVWLLIKDYVLCTA